MHDNRRKSLRRSRRLALGISVDELARELRLPANDVCEIEGGERPVMHRALFEQTFARLELARRPNGTP